jgi:hypothetical protein
MLITLYLRSGNRTSQKTRTITREHFRRWGGGGLFNGRWRRVWNRQVTSMSENETIELPLTSRDNAVFAKWRRLRGISDSQMLEQLIAHFDDLTPAQQKLVVESASSLGKTEFFPASIAPPQANT